MTSKNPEVKLSPTNKLYFRKYAYRIELNGTGMDMIRHTDRRSLSSVIDARLLQNMKSNRYQHTLPDTAMVAHLEHLITLKKSFGDTMRFRTEGDALQAYSEDFAVMKTFIDALGDTANLIVEATFPRNQQELDILKAGTVILRKSNPFKFKITTRAGFYKKDQLDSVWGYLRGLGSETKVSKRDIDTVLRNGDSRYVGQSYFYTNDTSITTFIDLIVPNFIQKIETVEVITK